MDTKKLVETIDALLVQLRAGDKSAIDRIVAAYNSRQLPAGTVLVKGWDTLVI